MMNQISCESPSDESSIATFGDAESNACRSLVALAIAEDLGADGDLTSKATIPASARGRVAFVTRSAGVVAGLPTVAMVVAAVDPDLRFLPLLGDGARIQPGAELASLEGSMRSLLAAERTALNFLQRLSGIASQTRLYVDALHGQTTQILDTRKTTPGWRRLEKYAVRCGGGHNHRMGLADGILIKDNHLAALGSSAQAIALAVEAARKMVGHDLPLEIEVDTLEQLVPALASQPDILLLDNMSLDHLREAVRLRNQTAPQVLLEASGGVTLGSVRAIAATGVDRISVGALTHSAPALDIAMDYRQ